MKRTAVWVAVATVVLAVGFAGGGDWLGPRAHAEGDDRPELGQVDWHRDFEEAVEEARRTDRPLFVLFTEVPGCSTVRGYGQDVLSHDLVAEAIESEFVPVAVYNNVEGEDREVLESFGEPTWNNPAVRIIEPDRTALAPRLYGDYDLAATVETMMTGLTNAEREVPGYLQVLHREVSAAGHTETAIFGMYCFWTGEAKLGRLDGVVSTRPGHLDGSEVVEVTYDTRRTSLEKLTRRAVETDAASRFYARTKGHLEEVESIIGEATLTEASFHHAESDDKYRLKQTPYKAVSMTDLQATLVNSSFGWSGGEPEEFLSPEQTEAVK